MVIIGMYGLGDNIYQRSVLREVKEEVYLHTTWPQLYSDLPGIKCVQPKTNLRTQLKNLHLQPASVWHIAPCFPPIRMTYTSSSLRCGSILKAMGSKVGTEPKIFDIPKFPKLDIPKPYAVIRPVTIRSEWYNIARGPEDAYLDTASGILRDNGYHVVSVADICEKEWCKQLPEVDTPYNHGELIFEQLMGLIQNADLVVGGVGWIVPACVASKTPLIVILGGCGGHNSPEKIIDKPMDLQNVNFIFPDNFCMCKDNRHVCNKTISGFEKKFLDAVKELL